MDIHLDPLFRILVPCFLLLFLLFLIPIAVLTTRSKSKHAAQIRGNLREGIYDQFFKNNPKTKLAFRVMGGIGLIFGLGILVVLALLMYSLGKAVGFDYRAYWFVIIIPFICSFPVGLSVFLCLLYKERKTKK